MSCLAPCSAGDKLFDQPFSSLKWIDFLRVCKISYPSSFSDNPCISGDYVSKNIRGLAVDRSDGSQVSLDCPRDIHGPPRIMLWCRWMILMHECTLPIDGQWTTWPIQCKKIIEIQFVQESFGIGDWHSNWHGQHLQVIFEGLYAPGDSPWRFGLVISIGQDLNT